MTKKKQYDLKEMERVVVLLTKQVQLLEKARDLIREIGDIGKVPKVTPGNAIPWTILWQYYYPPVYIPPYPGTQQPWDPPYTVTCSGGNVESEAERVWTGTWEPRSV